MQAVLESLVPIYLLILTGVVLRRARLVSDDGWKGMERLSFYLFFPALLVLTLYRADFSGTGASAALSTFAVGVAIILAAGLALRRPVSALLGLSDPAYSSVYQGFTRWNAFIALAITEKLFGADGLVLVAIAILVMVIPINVASVMVLTWLGERNGAKRSLRRDIGLNPIVLSALAGSLLNLMAVPIYEPVTVAVEMIGDTALPIGLILVGAGLRPSLDRSALSAVALTAAMKLLGVPLLLVALGYAFGLEGRDLVVMAAIGAVPTAMQGFVLAREMGGDATLFASISTAQAIASVVTIPLVIYLATVFFAAA
ncbi:MAG: AEC family transporter [Nitratireductor sp.]|nr:AEC family transporter [Nitratireductor sp.]